MMKSAAICIVLSAFACLAEAGCSGTDFDYMAIVQQWPPTAAKAFGRESDDDFFTLHGVWPNDYNGDYPCNCDGESFDVDKLKPIEDELDKYWASLKCEGGSCNTDFWKHEWSKHGTCAAAQLNSISGQLDYFKMGLKLRSTYDVLQALKSADITPTNAHGYHYDDMMGALNSTFNKRTVLSCAGQNDLDYVQVCINNNFTLIDCPSALSGSCDWNYDVWLPAKTEERRMLRARGDN